jgi:holliday junction DNA helicase RuvA
LAYKLIEVAVLYRKNTYHASQLPDAAIVRYGTMSEPKTMIRSLRGTIEYADLLSVVVSVGGVGYLVHMNTLRYGYDVGDDVHLHTHLAVRETALDLYGFPTRDELAFFELLMTIPKIGPKSALQVLGHADIATLSEAVRIQDATLLHKLSGIGKKTAESIVSHLRDKLAPPSVSETPSSGTVADRQQTDAIDALVTLGYAPAEARSAVRSIDTYADTKDLVTQALRTLSRN